MRLPLIWRRKIQKEIRCATQEITEGAQPLAIQA